MDLLAWCDKHLVIRHLVYCVCIEPRPPNLRLEAHRICDGTTIT
jgi:hypothetical protein